MFKKFHYFLFTLNIHIFLHMKTMPMIISIILFTNYLLYSDNGDFIVEIDTSRFQLEITEDNYFLVENLQKTKINLKLDSFINQDEEDEEKAYVSSFIFSEKVNSFKIGNGLIGIQASSFSAMIQGSAQVAAGRDIFLIYNPEKNQVYDNILDFGITKQRSRYMGCLSAKTSHFILADVDKNGWIDIGRIKEELKCEEINNKVQDAEEISGPFFIQDSVEWYVFGKNFWVYDSLYIGYDRYIDLPLIDIKLTPIDFFGFIKWQSYDPEKWHKISNVNFYPRYRLLLIKNEFREN